MSPAVRLGAFLALLAALFVLAFTAGSALGPVSRVGPGGTGPGGGNGSGSGSGSGGGMGGMHMSVLPPAHAAGPVR